MQNLVEADVDTDNGCPFSFLLVSIIMPLEF